MAQPWIEAQQDAFKEIVQNGRSGVFVGPSKSGKSTATYHITRNFYNADKTTCNQEILDWKQWPISDDKQRHINLHVHVCKKFYYPYPPDFLKNNNDTQFIIETEELPNDVRLALESQGYAIVEFKDSFLKKKKEVGSKTSPSRP